MTHKIYDKLVRDNIPHILETNGVKFKAEFLSDTAVVKYVMRKLGEESAELFEAMLLKSKEKIVSELADILSVLFKICLLHDIDPQVMIDVEEMKSTTNGFFDDNCVLKYVDEPIEETQEKPKKKPRKKKPKDSVDNEEK